MSEAPTVFRCSLCGLPWARIENGCLVVESKHHGQKHINMIALEEIIKLCQKESTPNEREQVRE